MGRYFNNKKQGNPILAQRKREEQIIVDSYKAYMLLALMTLRDDFGFGNKRTERFIDKMHDILDSYEKGYVSIDDLNETIKAEVGVDVMATTFK